MMKISMASDWKLWCVKQIGVCMMCDVCVCTTRLTDVLGVQSSLEQGTDRNHTHGDRPADEFDVPVSASIPMYV